MTKTAITKAKILMKEMILNDQIMESKTKLNDENVHKIEQKKI